MNLEFNKIFAAVLVAGITAGLAGFVASEVIHPHKLHENAYKIEGVEAAAPGAKEAKAEPILDLIASADPAKGEQVAKVCASCHTFKKGGPNGLGPDLWGVIGRDKGSHEGFDYSATLKALEGNWTYADLNQFLWNPKKYAPGTKMNFIGLKKPQDRANVIAWLHTLDDSPKPPPSADEIAAEKALLGGDDAAAAEGSTTMPANKEVGEPAAEIGGGGKTQDADKSAASDKPAATDKSGKPADGAKVTADKARDLKPVNPVSGSAGAAKADEVHGGTEGSKATAHNVPGAEADDGKVTTKPVDGGTPDHEKDEEKPAGDQLVP